MTNSTTTSDDDLRDAAPDPRLVRWGLGILWVAALVAGLVGLWWRLTKGHLAAGYGSYVPWGLWVALYFHGVGIAGGAFVVGALGYLLGWPGFADRRVLRATIVLAGSAILPAFLAVWLDLGRMDRAANIFLHANFTSMMALNAWMYGVFLLLAAGLWVLTFRRDRGWLKPLLCLGMLFAMLFPSQSGAFFGVVEAKRFWHSALLPLVFLASALVAGTAMLYIVHALRARSTAPAQRAGAALGRLRGLLLGIVATYFVFEFAEFSIHLWNPRHYLPEIELVLFGPYWWVFWLVHLLLGGLLPVALLAARWRPGWLLAALLLAVCFVSSRLNVLVPGQAVSELRGLAEAFHHPRLEYLYQATIGEYFVGFLLLAVGIAVFVAGSWLERRALRRFGEPDAAGEEKHDAA